MSYGPSQERVGHLRSVSTNKVAKTGRDAGVRTPATGKTEHGKSTNPTSRTGRDPNPEVQSKTGVRTGRGDYPVPSPTRIDDKISGA